MNLKRWRTLVNRVKRSQHMEHVKGEPKIREHSTKITRARHFGYFTEVREGGRTIGIEEISVNKNVRDRKMREYIAMHELREGVASMQGKKDPHRSALRYAKQDRKYLGVKERGGHTRSALLGAGYTFEKPRKRRRRR